MEIKPKKTKEGNISVNVHTGVGNDGDKKVLPYANLMDTNLMDTNLMDTNLMDANLMDVNLMDANLKNCREYSSETLSCFIDRELAEEEYSIVQKHLVTCRECRSIVNGYSSLAKHFSAGIASTLSEIDPAILKSRIMERIAPGQLHSVAAKSKFAESQFTESKLPCFGQRENLIRKLRHGIQTFFFIQSFNTRKFYLQLGSVAAIIILSISTIYLQKKPALSLSDGPSAIVTSVDGDVSSVMILETQDKKHTIIWYKEV